ncbi:hypothetical protein [Phyllobacterium zundukense]|nr:hypothetical protein [Phyllobacterium zundukense]
MKVLVEDLQRLLWLDRLSCRAFAVSAAASFLAFYGAILIANF